jgi:hypothetical protein
MAESEPLLREKMEMDTPLRLLQTITRPRALLIPRKLPLRRPDKL